MARQKQLIRMTERTHPRYSFVVIWYEGRKRRCAYYRRREDARDFMSRKKTQLLKLPAGEIPVLPDELKAVMRARDLKVPLWEAVEAYAATAAARARSITVRELIGIRRASMLREGLSDSYLKELRTMLDRAGEMWPDKLMCDVTMEDVQNFVFAGGGAPKTLQKRRVLLGGLFEFARARKYVESNPAQDVKTPKVSNEGKIQLLSPRESRAYLLAVATVVPAILPAEAIRMFAGLRRAEVMRLKWEHVWTARGLIQVGAGLAKTRQRRLVDIENALQLILEATAKATGPVTPDDYEKQIPKAQELCGWRSGETSTWPENCLRHGYVSYHLAFYNDAARTELQAGHDRTTMFRNYRELVTHSEAEEFWSTALLL